MKYNPITVTDLNKYIKEKISDDEYLNSVLVKGEISNFKRHYTGHLYFTLKDENSLIKCVMFKNFAEKLNFSPKDGNKVIVFGVGGVGEPIARIIANSDLECMYLIDIYSKEDLAKELSKNTNEYASCSSF